MKDFLIISLGAVFITLIVIGILQKSIDYENRQCLILESNAVVSYGIEGLWEQDVESCSQYRERIDEIQLREAKETVENFRMRNQYFD